MKLFKLCFLFIIVLFCSCSTKSKDGRTDTYTSGTIKIAVDEGFQPIISEELTVFEALYPLAKINPTYCNEVDAINSLLNDSVRLAISTRRLSSKEIQSFNSRKFFPREIKLATDGIGLIVNNQNPDSLISVSQIRKVLTGEITTWKEIHPSSKLGKIQIVFDNPNSSTVRFAKDSICKGKPFAKNGIFAQKTNSQVFDFVSKTPNAIGIIGVNWIGARTDTTNLTFRKEVRVLAVSRAEKATPSNSFKPFQAYLALGDYPLSRDVYVLVNDPREGLPSGLSIFLTTDRGQRIILKSGLVPATQPVRIVNIKDEF